MGQDIAALARALMMIATNISENPVHPNFSELRYGEVRRIPLPRTPVNKGIRKGRGCSRPRPQRGGSAP
jgi:hypothetical protein